ncbi:hypothetical protein [Chromobacterium sphagni]|uniref:Uncharacterized protein n=1 Tax=Chromobacterium sphagni TaxID=1903179 RepID=A0A1S1WTK3_9NEIS|nr:hypothetical protein [Chromobacterium sphagni]OHX10314.1 hypothetical protein BI347_21220 [Chromobacterium sphagni]OHX19725.1 hypothetical protein BI344_08825 [Chromobacterium sphagni]
MGIVTTTEQLGRIVQEHRAYTHPIFQHWSHAAPNAEECAALLHQILTLCAATRPGQAFPTALEAIGLVRQAQLMDEIALSRQGNGAELARMAGHIVNRSGMHAKFADIEDQQQLEAGLRDASNRLLGDQPGYEHATGLMQQTRRAMAAFQRRARSDFDSSMRNLGTAFALEIIFNRSLIPGAKQALVDAGHYGVKLDDPEMRYLRNHWKEGGGESRDEHCAREALAATLTATTAPLILEGMLDFLDSLAELWDALDQSLLHSRASNTA